MMASWHQILIFGGELTRFFHVFPPAAAVGGLEFGLAAGGAAEQLARLEGLRPGVAR